MCKKDEASADIPFIVTHALLSCEGDADVTFAVCTRGYSVNMESVRASSMVAEAGLYLHYLMSYLFDVIRLDDEIVSLNAVVMFHFMHIFLPTSLSFVFDSYPLMNSYSSYHFIASFSALMSSSSGHFHSIFISALFLSCHRCSLVQAFCPFFHPSFSVWLLWAPFQQSPWPPHAKTVQQLSQNWRILPPTSS